MNSSYNVGEVKQAILEVLLTSKSTIQLLACFVSLEMS